MNSTTLEITQKLSLTKLDNGTLRITGTRIPIETVIYRYKQGDPPEEIKASYPTLELTDIYAVIGYYLSHREEVEEYIAKQERDAEEWRRIIEASPFAIDREAMRARLQERWQALQTAQKNGHHE
ncbi:MAG: DUF433 domain-containing protein [Acidobacteriota bacterium]|nr:DUF433 domain-containing protein [Acidobacteriota bacterium]